MNEWIPFLSGLYKQQITELNRNQAKCSTFFDCTAAQLQLQVRSLAQREMQALNLFLSRFDQVQLNPPDTVVFLSKTRNIYE